MHDYPVLMGKGFPHNLAHYFGSAGAGRARGLRNLNQTPQQQKMAPSRSFTSIRFQGKANVWGTTIREELIQQTTVMVCPHFPITILMKRHTPLEVTSGTFVDIILIVLPIVKVRCGWNLNFWIKVSQFLKYLSNWILRNLDGRMISLAADCFSDRAGCRFKKPHKQSLPALSSAVSNRCH